MSTLTYTNNLIVVECCTCGMDFAMPTGFDRRRHDDHDWFYCPAGHKQHYTGPSDAERAKQRAERLERQLANREEDVRAARASLIATKGHLTRAKKRADNGVCQHCNRSFRNVADHVRTQHPDAVQA